MLPQRVARTRTRSADRYVSCLKHDTKTIVVAAADGTSHAPRIHTTALVARQKVIRAQYPATWTADTPACNFPQNDRITLHHDDALCTLIMTQPVPFRYRQEEC